MSSWLWNMIFEEPRQDEAKLVLLHVYDLSAEFVYPNVLCKQLGFGAFHVGVEVHGQEWTFSKGCGVSRQKPKTPWGTHVYRETIEMGYTRMSPHDVHNLCFRLWKRWKPAEYEIYTKNCCHFADQFCIDLGVGPIPSWVNNLAGGLATLSRGTETLTSVPGWIWGLFLEDAAVDESSGGKSNQSTYTRPGPQHPQQLRPANPRNARKLPASSRASLSSMAAMGGA